MGATNDDSINSLSLSLQFSLKNAEINEELFKKLCDPIEDKEKNDETKNL